MKTINLRNIFLLGILLLSVTISACKKSDQQSREDMLIGVWNDEYVKLTIYVDKDELLGEQREKVSVADVSTVEFRANGTVISDGDEGKWRLSGDNLVIESVLDGQNITENLTVKELTNNRLVVVVSIEDRELFDALELPAEVKKLILESEYRKVIRPGIYTSVDILDSHKKRLLLHTYVHKFEGFLSNFNL